jgi:spore germination protein YaaH/flagellar hook assembly protein FlgD
MAAGILPGPGLAGAAASDAGLTTPTAGRSATLDASARGASSAEATAPAIPAPEPGVDRGVAATSPEAPTTSTAYEEWLAHEHDRITFAPGGRVTVGFTPRSTDTWSIGGRAPSALPAGRATGTAMAASRQGSATAAVGLDTALGSATGLGASVPPATAVAPDTTAATHATSGLRRQVFGFLPYWELSGASTSLNYGTLTTIAYFSVGADAAGNLRKRNGNGSLTTGWGGWTSSSMTAVINAAHAHGTRVVLTASVFAWSGTGAAAQRALLGSATARANFARQLVAAVRDRGADGVNLDFEPLVSGQEAHFVALIKTIRARFNAIHAGYQITFDTTGYIGNYPLEASVGPSAADAVFIMGYDYRTDSASSSGSVDPLSGPRYDLADTVRQYTARISPSRVILGLPWYGRAWSTASSSPHSSNTSGAKYGYSTAVNYSNIPALVAKYGRRWDAVEQSPYIVYRRQNCTSAYGCVTSWRQVWYDDASSLGRRYQLVNDYGLRGAGMWALGYDGGFQDMVRALSDAFLVDHAAPQAGIRVLQAKSPDEGIVVAWSSSDVSKVRSYDVQVSVGGGRWSLWLAGVTKTADVWPGADGHSYAFRVRATDAKGNVGAWNVTTTSATPPSSLSAGGFGRVTLDGLAYRTGPSTSAARLGSLPAGTTVALTAGPVAADGYTWYEATQPIREWPPVSFVERGVWIAVKSSGATNVVPVHAPNTTIVDAGITGFDFGGGGLTGSSAAAVAGRTFSPNGDGSRDAIRVRWTANVAFDSLTLNVLRLDGSRLGSVDVPTLSTGSHGFTWDGTVNGKRVADGRYLLQLAGLVGSKPYRAPSALPATKAQIAKYAVSIDTVSPVISSASASARLISPNGDGLRDSTALALRSSGATSWIVRIALGSADPVRTVTGTGGKLAFTWNGRNDAGAHVPDGKYTVTLAACDMAGNCATKAYAVRVDRTPPTVTPVPVPGLFSPNGDGASDTASLRWAATEASSGTVAVWRGTTLVRRWSVGAALAGSVSWNGRSRTGAAVPDGRYTVKVDLRDAAGNRTVATSSIVVDRTVGGLHWSGSFFPQDNDALAKTSKLSWRLTRTATTTLALFDGSGNLVRTVWTRRSQAAGTRTWTWNGRLADGTLVPQGAYQVRLTVVSSYGTQILTRTVWAAAFPASLSASTVHVGHVLTVGFAAGEPVRTAPRVTFRQPGLAPVTITATKLADGTYRARFVVRASAAGTATVRIAATDAGGRANASTYTLAVAL